MNRAIDPRRHAFRPDLADERLRDRVLAPRYAAGEPRQVIHGSTPVRGRPDPAASWTTEAQFGEVARVFDEADGWAWIQLEGDGYVGYVRSAALSAPVRKATHRVRALGTFIYPEPDMKSPPWLHLSMNAELAVVEIGPAFARLEAGGYVPERHIAELASRQRDFVTVAERFLGVPYQWGGKTCLGLDCSGLVQVSLAACGIRAPRDSDMQERELGLAFSVSESFDGVRRGDLVFWKGHVGILMDAFTLLHANAHHMGVVAEPLRTAIDRIEKSGSTVTSVRRLHDAVL